MTRQLQGLRLAEEPAPFHRHDVDYLRVGDQAFQATIYQPLGRGPFPALALVHGGAWTRREVRRDEHAVMHEALAAMGIVVVAVDFRQSERHHYPDSVADVNYAIRWVRKNAALFNVSARHVGAFGSSSGGHLVLLNSMRPAFADYACLPLEGMPPHSASPDFIILGYPISDPHARLAYARKTGNQAVVACTHRYFAPADSIFEGNPQHVLDRRQQARLPPGLLLQGSADAHGVIHDKNVSPEIQSRFADAYGHAGGEMRLAFMPGAPHNFFNATGPHLDAALRLMRDFINRQLAAC